MSEQGWRTARGRIRRRLLVNTVVDPEEAAGRLPEGLRPRVTDGATVVGCCLLELDQMRPARLPERSGLGMRAAAHRIAVEWDGPGGEVRYGVYVPVRYTGSHLAVAVGGRWLPGVHRLAGLAVAASGDRLTWQVERTAGEHAVAVSITAGGDAAAGPVADACIGASVGLSPDHRGRLEAVHMAPAHRHAEVVRVDDLHSGFVESFASARPAPAFLIRDVDVTWTAVAA